VSGQGKRKGKNVKTLQKELMLRRSEKGVFLKKKGGKKQTTKRPEKKGKKHGKKRHYIFTEDRKKGLQGRGKM